MILPLLLLGLGLGGLVAALAAATALLAWRRTRRAERTQRRLEQVIEHAPQALLLADARGAIALANAEAERLFGHPRAALVQMRIEDLVPPRLRGGHDAQRAAFHAAPRRRPLGKNRDLFAMHRDGHEIPVEIALSHLEIDGAPQVLSSVVDVTDRVRAAAALREAKELAERASARAEEGAREKIEFLATVSHELRTPMNAILGLSSLVLGGPLDADTRRMLEAMHGSAAGLLSIINDILDYSSIEAGTLVLEKLAFSPRTVAQEVVDLLEARAAGKGLELVLDVAPDVPDELVGDPGRLRQVLFNLAANAVKFTERGEVIVRLAVPVADADRVLLCFRVIDTGIGVPTAAQARLFRPFSQADGTPSRRHGGTGIGLAICRRLCDLMGGAIAVDSHADAGSTFTFTVTLGRVARAAAPPPPFHGRRVLVAERNAAQRAALVAQLRAWQVDIEETGDAGEALARLGSPAARYDAALLDVRLLPGGASLPAGGRGAPIIELAASGAAAGTPPFGVRIPRPFHRSALYAALSDAFGGGARRAATPKPAAPLAGVRVLLAEDNAVNQMVAVRMLERLGCRVDLTANGQEAVDAALARPFDLVLMDCQMPEMDGYEATRTLRRRLASGLHATRGDVPIIAMTANSMRGDRERCLDAGMDDYLPKPVSAQALEVVVRRWAPAADRAALIDPARLAGLKRDAGDDAVTELVQTFAGELAGWLRTIADAADGETLRRAAHSLRGASSSLGAVALAARCTFIEERARGGAVDEARAAARELAPLCERTLAELRGDG